jgi:hypothetical protein
MPEPTPWSDEDLSAFLDGALDETTMLHIAEAIEADPELAARLADFAAADAAAKAAFNAPLSEPLPERFRIALERPPSAEIVDMAARRRPAPGAVDRWRLPVAAALALALGGLGGAVIAQRPSQHAFAQIDATIVTPANPLHRILSSAPSDEVLTLARGDQIKPVLTFVAADGRVCREFEMASERAMSVGVACRETQDWRLEILVAAADRPAKTDGYQQASGYDERAISSVLERLGAGEALDPSAEKAALSAMK